jgi:hypothetical protein
MCSKSSQTKSIPNDPKTSMTVGENVDERAP